MDYAERKLDEEDEHVAGPLPLVLDIRFNWLPTLSCFGMMPTVHWLRR